MLHYPFIERSFVNASVTNTTRHGARASGARNREAAGRGRARISCISARTLVTARGSGGEAVIIERPLLGLVVGCNVWKF